MNTLNAKFKPENEIFNIQLDIEKRRELIMKLKEFISYCTINRVKDNVDARDMALYSFLKGNWVFESCHKMREDTINYYDWIKNPYDQMFYANKKVETFRKEIKELFGKENCEKFFRVLNERIQSEFH